MSLLCFKSWYIAKGSALCGTGWGTDTSINVTEPRTQKQTYIKNWKFVKIILKVYFGAKNQNPCIFFIIHTFCEHLEDSWYAQIPNWFFFLQMRKNNPIRSLSHRWCWSDWTSIGRKKNNLDINLKPYAKKLQT